MAIRALAAMVFVDRDCGPPTGEIERAARASGGYPGQFLRRLRAASFDDHVVRIGAVHESSAAYTLDRPRPHPALRQRGVGRALRDAAERGARLAARGRHASAVRLLTRASRVLEGRGELQLASACAATLGWIDRDRGRSVRALESFERARALASDSALGVSAAIGIGVVWTDQRRFGEAEAALRGACTAADLLEPVNELNQIGHLHQRGRADPSSRALRALARCLHWQSRHEEAVAALAPLLQESPPDVSDVDAWALMARAQVSAGDLRAAVAAASTAWTGAERPNDPRTTPRTTTTAAWAMARVQVALGDGNRARHWIECGLRAAASAHLPIAKLRLRALLDARPRSDATGLPKTSSSSAICARRSSNDPCLPWCRWSSRKRATAGPAVCPQQVRLESDRTLRELQRFLEAAQAAHDDRTALEELCGTLAERLHAATVQIVAAPESRARSHEPAGRGTATSGWSSAHSAAGTRCAGGNAAHDPRQAAEPIRYGPEAVAVLCCRWTPGMTIDPSRASMLLRAGALAAAASVRGLLDRVPARRPTPRAAS